MDLPPHSALTERKGRPNLIRAAAILQSLYAMIEIADCIAAVLMALSLVGNYYPKMLFQEMQTLFDSQAGWLVPLFLFYTTLRVTSAIGLWRNRMWGFWLAVFVSTATLIMAPLLLPFTAVEMLLNGVLVAMLLIGLRDAGEEAMRPKKEHAMYGGIYTRLRHQQAVGEVFLFLVMALLLHSPFLALFSLIYFPIFLILCYAEEQDLLLRYGDVYAEYCKRTGAFWPKSWSHVVSHAK